MGPKSAGAVPGPACYGAGGPLTVTDVNLLLGRLDPSRFGVPVNEDAARRAFATVREAVGPWDLVTVGVGVRVYNGSRIADEHRRSAAPGAIYSGAYLLQD